MSKILQSLGADNDQIAERLSIVFDYLSSFALWLTLAVAVAVVAYLVALRNDADKLPRAKHLVLGVVVGYCVGVIGVLGFLKLSYYVVDGKINTNFWLIIALFAFVAVGIAVCFAFGKRKVAYTKWIALGVTVVAVAYSVVLAVVIPAKKPDYQPLSTWQMALFTVLLVVAVVAIALVDKNGKDANSTKALSYAAICVAMSFALSYVKFFSLPQGGSVTFASMLPLCLYAYMFGCRRGVIAGVVYGLLQFVQSPQFYQPMQVLIDYPIAFATLGVAGIGKLLPFLKGKTVAQFALGASVAITLRYVAHVISGYYVFSSWAMEGYTALSWALVYNLFIFVDLAIVLAVGALALSSKTVRRMVNLTAVAN